MYLIDNFEMLGGLNGTAYTADIFRGVLKIGSVSNRGDGSGDSLNLLNAREMELFEKHVNEWASKRGCTAPEPESMFISELIMIALTIRNCEKKMDPDKEYSHILIEHVKEDHEGWSTGWCAGGRTFTVEKNSLRKMNMSIAKAARELGLKKYTTLELE